MKALTIQQPWASLIAAGIKRNETRSWKTDYRGRIAIHAGKTDKHIKYGYWEYSLRVDYPQLPEIAPLGEVICICELLWCKPVEDPNLQEFLRHNKAEQQFGNFSAGRYAWRLQVVEVFKTPIPAIGKLGLWEWNRD